MTIKPGKAGLKKKPTDKYQVTEVDSKALEKALFIEQVEMFGSVWNRFEDPRGYVWIQEERKDNAV